MMVFIPRINSNKKRIIMSSTIFNRLVEGHKRRTAEEIKSNTACQSNITSLPQNIFNQEKNKTSNKQKDEADITIDDKGKGVLLSDDDNDKRRTARNIDTKPDLTQINIKYNLIPRDQDKPALAKCNIKWSDKEDRLVYYVLEPHLTEERWKLVDKIKSTIEEEINVDFEKLKELELREYILEEIKRVLHNMEVTLLPAEKQAVEYYIIRDFIGVGKIEPLLHDPDIEDISCAGVGIPVYVYHKNSQFGSLKSNIIFKTKEELDTFVIRLAQRSGKHLSVAEPLVDGSLPDGSRVQATLSTDIARRGSNFTIRKFNEKPLTPIDILKYGTADPKLMSYLWLATEYGKSMIISGTTASGKTSMLNALSLFIRPEKKIVTIEDTAELRLPHQHWVPEVARTAVNESGGKTYGSVDMYDLLRESLRQRPEYIVVGEVRGKEAYVMFQQMATGHTGLSTIHADDIGSLIDRLTTPPISLHESLIQNLDVIIFLASVRHKGKNVRRIMGVYEIQNYTKDQGLKMNKVFEWNPLTDSYDTVNSSLILKDIRNILGVRDIDIKGEITNRMNVLKQMTDQGTTDYREVSKIFNMYYNNPRYILDQIQ